MGGRMIELDEDLMDAALEYAGRFWNAGKRDERLMREAVVGYLEALAKREERSARRLEASR